MFFMEVHLEVIHEKNLFNGHCGLILYKKIYKNTLKTANKQHQVIAIAHMDRKVT